ncbi:MAG: hypothetical protein SGBAC_008989 [Bacillariaceae sp.]
MPWQTSCHHDISQCSIIPSSIRYEEESIINANNDNDSSTETKNRFAVANQEFQPGDIILRNAPLACSLLLSLGSSSSSDKQSQRCAYCAVSGSEQKLSRCGRCQSVWYYCSRDCQKKDFPLHKKECYYWTKIKKDNLASSSSTSSLLQHNDRVRAEISLLIRTYSKIELLLQEEESSDTSDGFPKSVSPSVIIHSGIQHLASLAQYPLSLDASEESIISEATAAILWYQQQQQEAKKRKKKKESSEGKEEVGYMFVDTNKEAIRQQMEDLLRIFRVNNFGITDELLKVIASAVYPLGALLNHSCQPNCILRYCYCHDSKNGNRKAPPILEIVASRFIPKGEELTHSYVELVQPRKVRQERLQSNYGFECHCQRCCRHHSNSKQRPETTTATPFDWMQLQDTEQVEIFLDHHNPTFASSQQWTTLPNDSTATSNNNHHAIEELRQMATHLQAQAKQCMAMDNLEGEITSLNQCIGVLSQILQTQLGGSANGKDDDTTDVHHQTCLELYQVRGDLLGTLIVAGQIKEAIRECEYVVAFLVSILMCDEETMTNCPYHPILGLQLFTLGDLYKAVVWEAKAQRAFAWASKIMLVSHGKDSNMVKLLRDR